MVFSIVDTALKIFDKVIPDPKAKAEAQLALLKLHQDGELAEMNSDLQKSLAQLKVNEADAASGSNFRGGWRPFIGWIGGVGFAYAVVLHPLLAWYSGIKGYPPPPVLNTEVLMTMLMGILGLGGYRTFEKAKKVA